MLSFGVSGWETAQELQALWHFVWKFDLDVAFLTENDLRNKFRDPQPMKCRPFFDLVANQLIPDESPSAG